MLFWTVSLLPQPTKQKLLPNVGSHILHHSPTRIGNQKHIQLQRFFCMKAATFQNRWRCGRIALKSSASNSRTAPLNSVQIVSCHRSWMARCPERKLDNKQKFGDIIPDTLSAFEPWNSRLPLHMGHPRTECSAKSHKTPLISSGRIRSCKRQGLCFKEPSYEFLDKIQI